MNDLKQFQRFGKKNELKKNFAREVWCYTRVSSIDQQNNYSLKNQKDEAESYAQKNGYMLVRTFGGTYESGKDDFTRKEFMKLLSEVKKSRKKPFAIIVYKMNRFSRSGGKSIALANELVYNQGVHLIEIVSGIDTTTRKGQNELNKRLLAAEEENINKLEHTLPGLKSFLRAGNWLGVAPEGYNHEGTRVNDFNKRATVQRISLNEKGRILKRAWDWKVQGDSDIMIIKRLDKYGVNIQKSKISRMWRNVFYCGLISHKLLDGEVVEGNHEPMVSRETFLKVQDIVSLQKQGYTVKRNVPERPLNDTLFCYICGAKLTGYKATGKTTHYYKCNKCKGVSINADTSKKMKNRTGAHYLLNY